MCKNTQKPQAFIPSCQVGITFSLMEGEKISPAVQPLLYLHHHLLAPMDSGGALPGPRWAAPVAPPAAPGWRMVLGARHSTGCGNVDPFPFSLHLGRVLTTKPVGNTQLYYFQLYLVCVTTCKTGTREKLEALVSSCCVLWRQMLLIRRETSS